MQGFRLFRYHSFKDQTRRGTHGFINQTRRRHFDELSCIYIIWIRINHGHVLYMISKYISIYYYIYYENKYIWYIIYYIYICIYVWFTDRYLHCDSPTTVGLSCRSARTWPDCSNTWRAPALASPRKRHGWFSHPRKKHRPWEYLMFIDL